MSKNIDWVARVDSSQYQDILDLVKCCKFKVAPEYKYLFDMITDELTLKILFNPNDIGKDREK